VNPAWRASIPLRMTALCALGRPEEAEAVGEAGLARARRFGAASTTGILLRSLGLARGAAGEAELREAVALLGTTPRRLEHAHSLAALADAVADHRPDEAAVLRRQALVTAASCSADVLRQRLQSALVAAGVPAQQVRDDLAALTSVERRVARLLAVGADSVAVAQALFLTPSAAQRHVEDVRRKLAQRSGVDA
jgi:DNA-binding CsgD family transcriptional regulator